MTQVELARAARVSRPTLWLIETGQRKPYPSTLQRIADALGVEAEELMA